MSDDKEVTIAEPETVEIPLDSRSDKSRHSSHHSSRHSSQKSSTSTSSFEDVNQIKTSKVEYTSPDPPTIEVEEVEENAAKATPKGVALTFKTSAFEDPTYYAQTTSLSNTPPPKSARVHVRAPNMSFKGSEDDRDPENVNDIVKIKFEEVFAEPEGTYSFGTIWGASFRIFTDSKLWCYKFLSAICGVPCALCWGIHFACLSFCQIWYYQPGIRSLQIQVRPLAKVFSICIKSFIEPCFEAFGKLFSGIRVHTSTD